ncbi:MAG: metal-dependent hydrolase [bacterium]
MYPVPGHVALAMLGNRYGKADWIPVLIGGLLPDLIDKPLNDILQWTPHGRYAMHSLTAVVALTLAIHFFTHWQTAYSYMIGHLSHLLGDSDFNPWFWPFVHYRYPPGIDILEILSAPGTIFFPGWILLETIILGLVIFLYTRYAEKRSVQAAALIMIAALTIYRLTCQRPA